MLYPYLAWCQTRLLQAFYEHVPVQMAVLVSIPEILAIHKGQLCERLVGSASMLSG